MALTPYQTKIKEAYKEAARLNQEIEGRAVGASPLEVTTQMQKMGTLASLDSTIDIADQMKEMANAGYL